jgi:RNA polymerase sigma-70 factor, ECF subfamily
MVFGSELLMNSAEGDRGALAQSLRTRDPEVIEQLIDRYQYRLFRYLTYLTGNREVAEDLFQETWIRVLERGHRYDGRSKFDTWLFTIARNLFIDRLRSQRVMVSIEEYTDSGAPGCMIGTRATDLSSPFDLVSRCEAQGKLSGLMDRLPVASREALMLRFQEEFSLEEIATLMEVPISTVKSRIYRGIALLRESLEDFKHE